MVLNNIVSLQKSLINMNKENNINVVYPYELYNSLKKMPVNNVFPCSTLLNDNLIGGLLFTCSKIDLNYFNINANSIPEPEIKFRMANVKNEIFLIEIHLEFENERILKLHLNPIHPNVKILFDLIIKKKIVAFHFYNKNSDIIGGTYVTLNEDDLEWVTRNYNLMLSLKQNEGYQYISNYMESKFDKKDRLYLFNSSKSTEDSFIHYGKKVIQIDSHRAPKTNSDVDVDSEADDFI